MKTLDTAFTAKLVDVYPPNADFPAGVDLNIADSIVRARYRNGPAKAELLTPGQPYEFTIEMYPTSLVFKRGHRIRLDISSSNFPRFTINPNRRTAQQQPPFAGCREHHLSGREASITDHPSGHSIGDNEYIHAEMTKDR